MDATPNDLDCIAKRKRQNVLRVQRCRARKQAGARIVRIEVMDWAATLAAFVRVGVLAEDQRNNDRAIEAAIAQLCRAGFRAVEARQKASV